MVNQKETADVAAVTEDLELRDSSEQTLLVAMQWATNQMKKPEPITKEEIFLIERIIGSCIEIIRISETEPIFGQSS